MRQICDMVDCFMDAGLTYYGTAYVYDGGDSEIATRKAQLKTSMERLGVACGQCEGACPQGLPIISYLEEVAGTLE